MVKYLDTSELEAIRSEIMKQERATSGQIRVHIRTSTDTDILVHAKTIFKKLKMRKTRLRNGVLILVDPRNRRFAIFGDEGIHKEAGDVFWRDTRDVMEKYFLKNELKQGIIEGVRSVGLKLKQYFPAQSENINELPDEITQD